MRMTIITDISEYFNLSGTFREADAIAEITNGYAVRLGKGDVLDRQRRCWAERKQTVGRTRRERKQTARAPARPALLSSLTH
jgi:hypothetical protein